MTVDKKAWPELRYKLAGETDSLDSSQRLCSATSVACRKGLHHVGACEGGSGATGCTVQCLRLLAVCFVSLLLLASVTGTYLLWFTGFFEDLVHSVSPLRR